MAQEDYLLSANLISGVIGDFGANVDRHIEAEEICVPAGEATRHGRDLVYVPGGGYGNEVGRADGPVGRIEGDPASAWYENLNPGMGCARLRGADPVLAWIEEVTRD